MMGTYRTYDIKLTYYDRVKVFVPDGECADDIIENKVEEMFESIPAEIENFDYFDIEYEEV